MKVKNSAKKVWAGCRAVMAVKGGGFLGLRTDLWKMLSMHSNPLTEISIGRQQKHWIEMLTDEQSTPSSHGYKSEGHNQHQKLEIGSISKNQILERY